MVGEKWMVLSGMDSMVRAYSNATSTDFRVREPRMVNLFVCFSPACELGTE